MIIDTATRLWDSPEAWPTRPGAPRCPAVASRDEHNRATANTPITFVLGYRSALLGADLVNEALTAHVRARPDRRLLFAGVDLASRTPERDLDETQRFGARGIAISPADQGVRPTDERALAILESCARRRLVVHVSNPCLHDPRSRAPFASPLLFDEAARDIPGLRLVFGDLGRAFTEDALMMIAKHPSAFAEVSPIVTRPMTMLRVLSEADERGVIEKLLFASGFPNASPDQAIEAMYQMQAVARRDALSGLTRQAVRGIVERDSLALLDLRAPEAAPPPTRQRAAVVVAAAAPPSWREASG